MKTLNQFILETTFNIHKVLNEIPYENENVTFESAEKIVKDLTNEKITNAQLKELFKNFDENTTFKFGTGNMCTADLCDYLTENDMLEGETTIQIGDEDSDEMIEIGYYNINNIKFIYGGSDLGDDRSIILTSN